MDRLKGETDNCRNRLLKYCTGQGLDLGCGNVKIKRDSIGIDLLSPLADMGIDARLMPCYPDNQFDYIYSSHLLEEIQDTEPTLKEWLRILKDDGYLVLYQVDKEYYHSLDDPRCNQRHIHHFSWEELWKIFQKIDNIELIHHARYNMKMYGEWSFEIVVRKKSAEKIETKTEIKPKIITKPEIKSEKIVKPKSEIIVKPEIIVKSEYQEKENTLRIVTPCWNSGQYVIRCINSIKNQSVQNWKCYLCNDVSTDDTLDYIKKHTADDNRFVIIDNTEKRYVSGNYFHTLHREEINDQDICINIDGDDWLPEDNKVFERVLAAYDPDTWITFGQFREYSGRGQRDGWAKMPNWTLLRKTTDWRATHLRTFKTWLFRKIDKRDLISGDSFWQSAGDLSFMIPMLEMAGPEHSKLLTSYNYIYNTESDINDHKRGDIQKKCAHGIFQRPPYKKFKNMNVIIFSKDRACQLDLLLRSIKDLWENWYEFKIDVIWTYSNEDFKAGYEKIMKDHPDISFIGQAVNFKDSVVSATNTQKEYTMFLVDDIVFKEPFKLRDDFEKLIPDEVISISLRLCSRISHCYPLNIPTPSPDLSKENTWNWRSHIGDWGYPLSVDGNIYRTSDLIGSIKNGTYNNPNTFEDALRKNVPDRPIMACYDESKIVNIPINLVGSYPNRHGNVSADQLNKKYLEGNKLSLNHIKGFKNISPHQEIELKWED